MTRPRLSLPGSTFLMGDALTRAVKTVRITGLRRRQITNRFLIQQTAVWIFVEMADM
jgi:hypothetical protein